MYPCICNIHNGMSFKSLRNFVQSRGSHSQRNSNRFPYITYEAIEYYNTIARPIYEQAGWIVLNGMAMSRARPDYRLLMSWWNAQSHLGEKRSGDGIVYAMANALYTDVCL